ncbi:MAG: MFS transporter, partial [Alicyclobacillus sp.]|nr:MFS transporter [Alicyclobacillus sp.]
ITDAYAVATARALGTSYGTIRCLASLGFATGGYVGGSYIAHLPLSTLWLPYAGAGLAGALVALSLPRQDVGVAVGGSFQEGLAQLLHNKRFLVFLLGGLLVSQTLTAFNTYFALTFRAMGGSLTWTGVAFFLASATNVPAMLVASRVIRKVGREPMMALAALAYLLRWGIQAFIPHPAVAVAVQALHGLSFGFYYVAAVDFVFTNAPRQLQATAQSLFGMVSGGLAGILGNLLNGWLLQLYGAKWMYVACTLSAAAGAVCFWAVRWLGQPTATRPRWRRGSHNPSQPWTGYR